MPVRTDLALEERELFRRDAGEQTELPGVWARETNAKGIKTTCVKILNEQGASQLHKPIGTYVTLELAPLTRRETGAFGRAAAALSRQLRALLPPCEHILVVGLGNAAVTPDAVGPEALKSLIVTRHLKLSAAEAFSGFASVSAAEPGVLGTTGVESVELVRGVAEHVKPEAIIVIDALAASCAHRLCTTVQLTDTGIVPGSGVQNARAAFNAQTLGAPVVAVGVPTVIDADALLPAAAPDEPRAISGMVVTPRDIDARVRELGRLIGYGIDLALHRGLTLADVASFVP